MTERLSASDMSSLLAERGPIHVHVGGTIVIADEERALEVLFGATATGRGVSSKTTRTTLAAIQVRGVPGVALEEALWLAASAMNA